MALAARLEGLPRRRFVHEGTPLVRRPVLDRALGVELYIKCDDATGGATGGNKARKLEYLLAAAEAEGADTVVTCGALQSNHARATALLGRTLAMDAVLLLHTEPERAHGPHEAAPLDSLPLEGNVLLDRMVGAQIRTITRKDYRDRTQLLERVADELRGKGKRPFVIPEGGSNALGSLGYVRAMGEVRGQIDAGEAGDRRPFDCIVHACGSGGTAAGVLAGAAAFGVGRSVRPMAVCDDRATFEAIVARILEGMRSLVGELGDLPQFVVDEAARGPRYGVMDEAQKERLVVAARSAGLILDPVYTGKAFDGLVKAIERGDVPKGSKVLFLHTGGLPGLLADGRNLESVLRERDAS
jgi:D-cysteine desulfhydrase